METQRKYQNEKIPKTMPGASAECVVLFTDMVSYSNWIERDESTTLEFVTSCFDTLRVLSRRHSGTLVKTMGDGALLTFKKADDAINCGVEFQRVLVRNQLDVARPYQFRVGLHCGEVVQKRGDVYGNTVNIAARLQSKATPGTCVISENVMRMAGDHPDLSFESIGTHGLRNLDRKYRLYQVIDPLTTTAPKEDAHRPNLHLLDGVAFDDRYGASPDAVGLCSRAIVGYLALCPGGAETFDRLATLAFFEDEEGVALQKLDAFAVDFMDRSCAGMPALIRSETHLALDEFSVRTDLDEYMRMLRQGSVPDRFIEDARWPEKIMAGYEAIGPVFRSWLSVTRRSWKRSVLLALERLLSSVGTNDAFFEDAATAILLLEPGNEMAALARINARLAQGDTPEAFAEFERLKLYLAENFDMAPNKDVQDRIDQVKSERKRVAVQSPTYVPLRRLLRLSVAPITGTDATRLAAAQAFRSELIGNLMRFRDWAVIDAAKTPAGNGDRDSQIDYSVEMAVLQVADPPVIQINLQTHDTARVLWAKRFVLSAGDQFAAMNIIIREIVVAIELYVSSDRFAETYRDAGRFATSYDKWLRGDRALMRWTPAGAEEALAIFDSILEEDPDNAPALFRRASIENIRHVIWPGRQRSTKDAALADRYAARAVELDPMDARIQRTVAWTAAMNGAFARASMHLDLAVSLNPNCPTTLASCAMGFAWFGDDDKADRTLNLLYEISTNLPDWIWAYNASTLFMLERYDAALDAAEKGLGSIMDDQGWICVIHSCQNEMPAAQRAFDRLCENVESNWAGPQPLLTRDVARWFTEAYPIRREEDRQRLRDAIEAAIVA
ncbi:adenylate/guanylate cyclase domain-containing protein [uncultured Ruegeria sp.]|uniref:adenylate/guanylate cyclase domain-containing protein n=1 Tax=uncultured Ruegeria sp. TaxID=259304 RepID=UPI00260A4494|nr:adenylate/guanylate cyclase domain-containing protein [uncultured Ruegeria sp.]